ncbi:MAG: sigma-70 family RNA polymerase sigma factor [Acidobacteria bacterium]|nr:sigma-70 family RNA polymerase sigma factor [Acidobacteriota bacterium]
MADRHPASEPGEITSVLEAINSGDDSARDVLYALVYEQLRMMARGRMTGRAGETLQPTALVHEAFLRLLKGRANWESRVHFFGAAAEAMRQILIERARTMNRLKRGGERTRVELEDDMAVEEQKLGELLDLDRALDRLEELEPKLAHVVKLRYFAGLTVEEVSGVLRVSPRSVDRMWLTARAWLQEQIASGGH